MSDTRGVGRYGHTNPTGTVFKTTRQTHEVGPTVISVKGYPEVREPRDCRVNSVGGTTTDTGEPREPHVTEREILDIHIILKQETVRRGRKGGDGCGLTVRILVC